MIRTTQEIAKDAILAEFAAGKITQDQLAEAGLRIGRREVFELELKGEKVSDCRFPIALCPRRLKLWGQAIQLSCWTARNSARSLSKMRN